MPQGELEELQKLPQPPDLEDQLVHCQMAAVFCADQVELLLKEMDKLRARSKLAQQQIATASHSEVFSRRAHLSRPASRAAHDHSAHHANVVGAFV